MEGTEGALDRLVHALLNEYGLDATLLTVGCVLLVAMAWRIWQERRRDRELETALAEKERTIQRLADECRGWRQVFLQKFAGMSEAEVRRIIVNNSFEDGPTARKAMENDGKSDRTKSSKRSKKKRRR